MYIVKVNVNKEQKFWLLFVYFKVKDIAFFTWSLFFVMFNKLLHGCALQKGVNDNMHWEVVDNDSFDDFHQKLCFLWISFDLTIRIRNILTLSFPQFQVNISNFFGESVIHWLHNWKYLTPNRLLFLLNVNDQLFDYSIVRLELFKVKELHS